MNCDEIKYQIIDFIDETLDKETYSAIQKHLNHCDSCQDEFLQVGKLLKLFSQNKIQEPSVKLKTNFYQMLEAEKTSLHFVSVKPNIKKKHSRHLKPLVKIAAQVIILISIGVIIGIQINFRQNNSLKLQAMQGEITDLKQNISLVALKQPSASERIKAIYSVEEREYSNEIFAALINTMNTDENVNVRMASMYALSKFSKNENVKSALIGSLKHQTDPLLQITLINILVSIQDNRAKDPINEIMLNKNTPDVVKKQAKTGLKAFT